jgi:hypothetical protein
LTQHLLEYELLSGLWNSNNANRETQAKAWWIGFRNALRALLPSVNWKVGDLFRWQGSTNRFGHGFLIRHNTIGEWLIVGSAEGTDSASSNAYFSSIFQNTSATYFLRDGANPTSLSGYFSGMCVTFNPTPATSWAIGYNVDLELGSGDWTAPTQNPHSALAAFWTASNAPMGVAFVDNFFDYRVNQRFHMLFDDVAQILRIDFLANDNTTGSERNAGATKAMLLSGIGFGPNADISTTGGLSDPLDTNPAMNCLIAWHQGDNLISLVAAHQSGTELLNRCYVMSLDGTTRLTDVTLQPVNDLLTSNFLSLGGNLFYRLVEAKSGLVLKGTLKSRICIETCPFRVGTFSKQRCELPTGSGNILVREHQAMAFIWTPDREPWPYSRSQADIVAYYT